MTSFTEAVETFKKSAAAWLTDEDSPAVAHIEKAAAELDEEVTAAMLSAFGLAYRNLLKRKPGSTEEEGDELDGIIPD